MSPAVSLVSLVSFGQDDEDEKEDESLHSLPCRLPCLAAPRFSSRGFVLSAHEGDRDKRQSVTYKITYLRWPSGIKHGDDDAWDSTEVGTLT